MVDYLPAVALVLALSSGALLVGAHIYEKRRKAKRRAERRKQAPKKKPVSPKTAVLSETSSQSFHLSLMTMAAARQMTAAAARNGGDESFR